MEREDTGVYHQCPCCEVISGKPLFVLKASPEILLKQNEIRASMQMKVTDFMFCSLGALVSTVVNTFQVIFFNTMANTVKCVLISPYNLIRIMVGYALY